MPKTTATYWNPLSSENRERWKPVTLSIDETTGEYTRLTRFRPGADQAFDIWLETGHYASRPPREIHGPFKTDVGCVVLELSFPNKAK